MRDLFTPGLVLQFLAARYHPTAITLFVALMIGVCGCGGMSSTSAPVPAPQAVPDAVVTGQYNLALTSTSGHGSKNIYTDVTQMGKALTGAATTLVCPSNDVSQCEGNDPPATSITPTGTVNGASVTITVSFPTAAGSDSVSMVGFATATSLAGTYTDTQGDAGTWTGSPAALLSGNLSGTFNSTAHPQPIDSSILIALTQDSSFNLTGSAMITSSPCIGSLTLSGQAIGQAFSLTDAANKVRITAIPTTNMATGNSFTFRYDFDPAAASCAGDYGLGLITDQNPWDY